MTLFNRPTWGSAPPVNLVQTALEENGYYGQYTALGVMQNLPAEVDAAGLNILQTSSLDVVATQINNHTRGQTVLINYSFNYEPWYGNYLIRDFIMQIVVKVGPDYPVNAANIQNALAANTILSYTVTAPAGTFASFGYLGGIAQVPPSNEPPVITPLRETDWFKWVNQTPVYSETEQPPQAAQITIRGVPVGMQDEDRFAPVGSFAYSPLTSEISDFQNVALVSILLALSRSPDGRDKIFKLADTYIKSTTKLLESIVESGKTHPLTALNASTAYAVTAHRFGILTDAGYLKMADQTRSIIDKLITLDFANLALDGLQTFTDKAITTWQMGK